MQNTKNQLLESLRAIKTNDYLSWGWGQDGCSTLAKELSHFDIVQIVQIADYFKYNISISGYAGDTFYIELKSRLKCDF